MFGRIFRLDFSEVFLDWLYSMSGQKSAKKMVNFRDKIGFLKMDKIGFSKGRFLR